MQEKEREFELERDSALRAIDYRMGEIEKKNQYFSSENQDTTLYRKGAMSGATRKIQIRTTKGQFEYVDRLKDCENNGGEITRDYVLCDDLELAEIEHNEGPDLQMELHHEPFEKLIRTPESGLALDGNAGIAEFEIVDFNEDVIKDKDTPHSNGGDKHGSTLQADDGGDGNSDDNDEEDGDEDSEDSGEMSMCRKIWTFLTT
ncbi:hypothetical protein ACH5RR_036905 [Cinchona calisaya]|uniref:Uncharacterized protein n=1 Tax=Cinchona calisaya TaxID=153742 RepID=A0ABD2Y601_9GENT